MIDADNIISPVYFDFFRRNITSRHVLVQGGRRSGKTYATFTWLMIMFQYIFKQHFKSRIKVVVICADYPQLSHTKEDFTEVTGVPVQGIGFSSRATTHHGRVRWQFIAFDEASKAQGTACEYAFINEAVRVPEGVAKAFMPGVRRQIYYNYNPTSHWWGEAYIDKDGGNYLRTTWRDNAHHLTQEQIAEFEAMKERAQQPDATLFDRFAYNVYYLGDYAAMVGRVFPIVTTCEDDVYFDISAKEQVAIDFGFATSGDPTTCIGVKVFDKQIYIHQYIYERGLTSNEELAKRLLACGFNSHTLILGDYGGQGRGRMDVLLTADNGRWANDPEMQECRRGFMICNAPKIEILDGLAQMCAMDGIVVTRSSEATRRELEGYELTENNKPRGADHAIDAARYAFTYLRQIM